MSARESPPASQPLMGDGGADRDPSSEQTLHDPGETSPLLSYDSSTSRYDGQEYESSSPAAVSLRSIQSGVSLHKLVKGKLWATRIAITWLTVMFLVIICGFFFAPAAIQEYAKQSLVIEPKGISIESFTQTGVRARVQGYFRADASNVKNGAIRNIGRLGAYIAHTIETEETEVKVYLPEYDDILIGIATVPKIYATIRNGEATFMDFVADIKPAQVTDLQRIANDWLSGRMGQLTLKGVADVSIKSGMFHLGTTSLSQSIVLEGHDIPNLPAYNITKLNFREIDLPTIRRGRTTNRRGVAADATIVVDNKYPITLPIPPLNFDILVQDCDIVDPYIMLAEASTDSIDVLPESEVEVNVRGIVRELPSSLTQPCPRTDLSPLDVLLGEYIHGEDATIYVRGSKSPSPDTPAWISEFISTITVPVPFPGRSFDSLIKNFTLEDVHFGMPDPFADPNSPESSPRISGSIVVMAALPTMMNFGVNVSQVRATADVFHEGKKLGVLDVKKWQKSQSERIDATDGNNALLKVESKIKDAPLNITDQDVFSDVVQKLLFGDGVILDVNALVDVEIETVLGSLIVRDVPGEGSVPVKAPSKGGLKGSLGRINPHVFDLKILDTSRTSLTLEAKVNFTNPTEYSATVPFFSIHILSNDSVIGQATVSNTEISTGNNSNTVVRVLWDPDTLGDANSSAIARNLISQYISGWNTTLTLQTHRGSIPSQPDLGESLSKFPIEVPIPQLSGPDDGPGDGDGDDAGRPRFIKDATFHLFSSTAVFTLLSPFQESTIFIEAINATAFYNHTEPVGSITYDLPFKVPPGTSQTPRLPVDWDPESVGYDRMKKALNGGLKLSAKADVKVRLDEWREVVWYEGDGIGAKVKL